MLNNVKPLSKLCQLLLNSAKRKQKNKRNLKQKDNVK